MLNEVDEFETRVADLLRAMGWDTDSSVQLGAHQLDIYAEAKVGVVPVRLAVECKSFDKKTGNAEIQEFASRAALLRSHGLIDKALIVSKLGFTASAKSAAESYGISCVSYDELISSLIDFSLYLKTLVTDYENSPMKDRFVEPSLRAPNGEVFPALSYLRSWLEKDDRFYLSLLGDAGSGKTVLCTTLSYQLAKDSLSQVGHPRIPVLISLRDYRQTENLRQVITDLLVNDFGVRLSSYAYFERLLYEGKLLLIFDGLDEISRSSDEAALRCFWEIADLAKPRSKVLLTCRTHYFRNQIEQEALLKGSGDPISWTVSDRPRFESVYLEQWSGNQIQEFVRKAFPEQWQEFMNFLKSTYNLQELSQSPALLEMITRTFPVLGRIGMKRAAIYRAYIDASLDREAMKRHVWFERDRIRAFLQELAISLISKQRSSIPVADLEAEVEAFFDRSDKYDANVLLSSVLTLPFLTRDSAGNYMFAHRSFMEYLVAERLASTQEPERSGAEYPNEIQYFLKEIINS
jgi:NACHT domain/Restriction endonuclease